MDNPFVDQALASPQSRPSNPFAMEHRPETPSERALSNPFGQGPAPAPARIEGNPFRDPGRSAHPHEFPPPRIFCGKCGEEIRFSDMQPPKLSVYGEEEAGPYVEESYLQGIMYGECCGIIHHHLQGPAMVPRG